VSRQPSDLYQLSYAAMYQGKIRWSRRWCGSDDILG